MTKIGKNPPKSGKNLSTMLNYGAKRLKQAEEIDNMHKSS